MKKYQKGFTLIELLFVFSFIIGLGVVVGVIYILFHFILKFW